MCRFLLLTISEPYDVRLLIEQFAHVCQHSRGREGNWQGDGWGLAWKSENEAWHVYRSLQPIWTETDAVQSLPHVRRLVVHARSASFAEHTGIMDYIEPYVDEPYAFVFNGFLKGVRVPRRVPGKIGAQKIWYLVKERLLQGMAPHQALQDVYGLLTRHCRTIQACNMGLSDGSELVSYNGNPGGDVYYQLHQVQQGPLRMICSEPFGAWAWQV